MRPMRSKSKKYQKKFTVNGSMTLAELDQLIRQEMDYDGFDHLSGFYEGKPHCSPEIATIAPFGSGGNSSLTIDALMLSPGSEIGYVYDFGDDIQSILKVEEVTPHSPINF